MHTGFNLDNRKAPPKGLGQVLNGQTRTLRRTVVILRNTIRAKRWTPMVQGKAVLTCPRYGKAKGVRLQLSGIFFCAPSASQSLQFPLEDLM